MTGPWSVVCVDCRRPDCGGGGAVVRWFDCVGDMLTAL